MTSMDRVREALQAKRTDTIKPEETGKVWTFESNAVAENFDKHVREQLSWYQATAEYTADMAMNFVPSGGVVYDIGASTGNMTRLMQKELEAKKAIVRSIEPSSEMAKMWRGPGELIVSTAEDFNFFSLQPDLSILFLTLMFMKPSIREDFIEHLAKATNPGGAIIIVDKGFIGTPSVQIACKTALMAAKRRAGQSGEAWVTKELSLRGEQRPTNASAIGQILRAQGFAHEQFFQFGEFYGMLAIKQTI